MSEHDRFEAGRGELPLTPELRTAFGLGTEEAVQIIDAGVRTILLERVGSGALPALPRDRDLALVADVVSFSLADLLNLVHSAAKSGFLFFGYRDHAKSVYLHRGEVVFASSNQPVDRIGECLCRAGVVTLEQLREAERWFMPPERFGKVLVERGFVTPRELWNGVKYQVEEIFRSLFSYTSGTVYFWEGEIQPDNVVRLSLPTRRLVSEGLQRRDELLRFLTLLEDPRATIEPVAGRQASLAPSEQRILEVLEVEPSFSALRDRLGLHPLSAARAVHLLRLTGTVRIRRVHDGDGYLGERDLRGHDAEALGACVADHVKLLAELAAPIVALEGAAPLRDRFMRVVADVALRFPALLEGIRPGPGAVLDPQELARRAVELPEPCEQLVRAALGELVAYLDFELKNHPRIADPHPFLKAVEPLRARLGS